MQRAEGVALWFVAAEPRSSPSLYGRTNPIVVVGLKQNLTEELDESAWRIRLGDGGFRWYKHVDRELAGYRMVMEVPSFNTSSPEQVALELNQRLVRAMRSARLLG